MRDEIGLDDEVTALLAGRPERDSDPAALWLAAVARPAPPQELVARVAASVGGQGREGTTAARGRPVNRAGASADRPGRWLSLVAAALAVVFALQGVGDWVAGEWIARNIGEPHGPHAFFEGGLAMVAAAVCAAAALVSRSWAPVSVLTCSPLAISLGVHGTSEIGVFAAGAALHLVEGALGVLLVVAWLADRRDGGRRTHEGRTWRS